MQPTDKRRLFFFIGLLAMAILYSVNNLYLLDHHFFEITTRATRHLIKFGSVLIAYGIGLFAFRNYSPSWLMQLWNILYAAALLVLIFLGIYDGWIREFSMPVRNGVAALHEFLISPVPFVVTGIINRAVSHPD
jgi:ABC-type uncharacterized transport system permease subunit